MNFTPVDRRFGRLALAALSLLALGSTAIAAQTPAAQTIDSIIAQQRPELPSAIRNMCRQLRSLDAPVRCLLLDSKRDVLLSGAPALARGVEAEFTALVQAIAGGACPSFDDALALHSDWATLERIDPTVEARSRIFVDYGRAFQRELCVMRFEDGRLQSELLTPTLELGFQSSIGRLRVAPRSDRGNSHFIDVQALVYPLSLDPQFEGWMSELSWSEDVLPKGAARFRHVPNAESTDLIVACFDAGHCLPTALLSSTRIGPNESDVAFSIAFFRHTPTYRGGVPGLGICEVLQFDTLAVEGMLALRHMTVFESQVGLHAEHAPLQMPVDFSHPRLLLKDLRVPGAGKDYGIDVSQWPADLLEHLVSIDTGGCR